MGSASVSDLGRALQTLPSLHDPPLPKGVRVSAPGGILEPTADTEQRPGRAQGLPRSPGGQTLSRSPGEPGVPSFPGPHAPRRSGCRKPSRAVHADKPPSGLWEGPAGPFPDAASPAAARWEPVVPGEGDCRRGRPGSRADGRPGTQPQGGGAAPGEAYAALDMRTQSHKPPLRPGLTEQTPLHLTS